MTTRPPNGPPGRSTPESRGPGTIDACRAALARRSGKPAHAGLLLASYLKLAGDKGESKRQLHEEAIQAARNARDIYSKAFARWRQHTAGAERNLTVRGRLVIGLGTESVLETGLTLHHTYGTPLIPGSALKGLAAHYCDQVWGPLDPEFRRKIHFFEDGQQRERAGTHYQTLFGITEDSGHIRFHDAWLLPDSLRQENRGLVADVMTPHHGDYYTAQASPPAPTDFDDPNPVSFLSVAGDFRVCVSCDVPGGTGDLWAARALQLLTEALAHWGVGGKTNAGYGRLDGAARS